ncbi:hypothetical protein J6590_005068 [Homalodisca vitripennis]|nr:hypothetical protein J6590_005068 [Homalodisca vitripennis]
MAEQVPALGGNIYTSALLTFRCGMDHFRFGSVKTERQARLRIACFIKVQLFCGNRSRDNLTRSLGGYLIKDGQAMQTSILNDLDDIRSRSGHCEHFPCDRYLTRGS